MLAKMPTDPPLETLWAILQHAGETSMTTRLTYGAGPRERFDAFMNRPPVADVEKRTVGNYEDMSVVYQNAWWAEWIVQSMAREIYQRKLSISRRANAAGVCLIAGSRMFDTALLLHLRPEPWNDLASCTIIRSTLEVAARAGFIATGISDEVDRWEKNAPRIEPRECLPALQPTLEAARPGVANAYTVYKWLCESAHLRSGAIEPYMSEQREHEATFAALAYVGWVLAVLTELVTGRPNLAVWPSFPQNVPWT